MLELIKYTSFLVLIWCLYNESIRLYKAYKYNKVCKFIGKEYNHRFEFPRHSYLLIDSQPHEIDDFYILTWWKYGRLYTTTSNYNSMKDELIEIRDR